MVISPQRMTPSSEVLLLGAGYDHIEVIRKFGQLKQKPFRMTLISGSYLGTYRGLFGRLLRRELSRKRTLLDLGHLCQKNGVRFLCDQILSVDVCDKEVYTRNTGQPVHFDVVSFDLDLEMSAILSEASETPFCLSPFRPLEMIQKLQDLEIRLRQTAQLPFDVVVTGRDLYSAEILFSLVERFRESDAFSSVKFTFLRYDACQHDPWAALWKRIEERMRQSGVGYYKDVEIEGWNHASGELLLTGGKRLRADLLVNACQNPAHSLLQESGLALDQEGLIRVNSNLESCSHPGIYAAGHSVSQAFLSGRDPRFCHDVRMGSLLFANLISRFRGLHQVQYHSPAWMMQSVYCGQQQAALLLGKKFLIGRWVFRRKSVIDDYWYRHCRALPCDFHPPTYLESGNRLVRPSFGSGDELPVSLLDESSDSSENRSLLPGSLAESDDLSVQKLDHGELSLVSTASYQRSFTRDLYTFASVFASHCVGRLVAAGVAPESAQLIISVEYGPSETMKRDFHDLNNGLLDGLDEAGARVMGTHAHASLQTGLGMTLSGFSPKGLHSQLWHMGHLSADLDLVLTKPLGTGIILAGFLNRYVDTGSYFSALKIMKQSDIKLLDVFRNQLPQLVIPVGGQGLCTALLQRKPASSGVQVRLSLSGASLFPGVFRALKFGIRSGLHSHNRMKFTRTLHKLTNHDRRVAEAFFDPQTAGAMVLAVPAGSGKQLIRDLASAGFCHAWLGGRTVRALGRSEPFIVFDT
ncbi:MAG: FAD-dependent oxidoreductase [Deltaproteobacteria bacterium]|nr:FAD-dependent oxidoreductase [Deltaproteobacteria bacterium]